MTDIREERLGNGVIVCTGRDHTIGTDACLLSSFSSPRSGERVCDLGCGCGVIPLLWFSGGNPPRSVVGLEVQPEAARLARLSAERSGLTAQFRVVRGDLRELPACLPRGGFDRIVCNPPYKAAGAGMLSQKESARIARHEISCTLDDVCAAASKLLRFGGRLCLCQLPERLPDLLERMRAHRIEPKRLQLVHRDTESPPWLVLAEGRLGSKPFLRMERPIFLFAEPGKRERETRLRPWEQTENGTLSP